MAASLDQKKIVLQARTAGHLIQLALEELLPEHHAIRACDGNNNQFNVTFTDFIDEINVPILQQKINEIIDANLPIIRKQYTQAEFQQSGIVIYYPIPKKLSKVSTITVGEYRPLTDGGTTFKSTGECWPITLTDFTYEEGFTTIHYRVDQPTAAATAAPSQTGDSDYPISLLRFKAELGELQQQFNKAGLNEKTRIEYLGKKGLVNQLAKMLPQLPAADRATAGKMLNELKREVEERITQHFALGTRHSEFLDVTLPATLPPLGHLHLISEAISEIEAIFTHLGFVRRRYPEIETDWYYAEGLNIPKNHPARDDQETFYFSDTVVLTAHTSNGQLREMEYVGKPPIKMINIGKTYRRQASNTHAPMFHQFEGLLVDKNINITHLIGVSNYFAQQYFGPDREIRLRPHHFQFTEPSFEVDINCHICKGRGVVNGQKCKVCKSGWLELGGAGMVHPTVLKNGGIDPDVYSGFAFGWGVERVIMMKHQVTDNLRELYTDDLRFLSQS